MAGMRTPTYPPQNRPMAAGGSGHEELKVSAVTRYDCMCVLMCMCMCAHASAHAHHVCSVHMHAACTLYACALQVVLWHTRERRKLSRDESPSKAELCRFLQAHARYTLTQAHHGQAKRVHTTRPAQAHMQTRCNASPCTCVHLHVHLRVTSVQANPWVAVYNMFYPAPDKPATVPSAAVVATPLSASSAAAAVAGGPA